MITVRSSKDVQFWTLFLRDLAIDKIGTDRNKDLVKEVKRSIRAYTNRPVSPNRIFGEDIDGLISVFPLPESISSREDAIEFFEENELIVYRPTYYDCTGQLFTSWYKIFQKPDGRFWAYHSIGRDV